MKYIYLDNAATTKVDSRVVKAMLPYFTDNYGNASSLHQLGQKNIQVIEKSRSILAKHFNCQPEEVIFTSGASESNNYAIKGAAEAYRQLGKNLVVCPTDHSSVINSAQHLANKGFKITWLKVDKHGLVDKNHLRQAVNKNTILVSIGHSNNEIGTIQPITELVKIVKARNPKTLFHTDAVQSLQFFDLDVKKVPVDLLTITGHKFYAPKGIGALYVKKGVHLEKLIDGGQQEGGKRSGTENIPYIAGMAKAIELVEKNQKDYNKKVTALRDRFINKVKKQIDGAMLTGHPTKRLPNIASFIFTNIEGESILLTLDQAGVAVSTGSACASHSLKPSHVLTQIGYPPELAHCSIRFSFGKDNTIQEIDKVVDILKKAVSKLRKISPLK